MKRIILIIMLFSSVLFAQDITIYPEVPYYHNTLTASNDTIDVSFSHLAALDKNSITDYTISIYTSAGADTVKVYSLSADDLIWCQQSTWDLLADTTSQFIIVSTTPKEYLISDSAPNIVRIISTSNDASTTIFTIQGKK